MISAVITTAPLRASRVLPRLMTQNRTIVGSMVEASNKVPELQKLQSAGGTMVGADDPTWLKQGTKDKLTSGLGLALCTTAMVSAASGFYHMANGSNKKS
eukprot:CAMPEP_0194298276 /NCGR_PEP_ID=MMETSP0169-20130528/60075_1 /TAXON_ID=218684 /ORGANISM="Corethron pennatum, Strain L29A3" /LENGTH=99 /DNA_ID=CAMNT_0039048243 /DNA_START=95 /DNA_END=394 /DNA_ORIENTATION=+